MGHKAIEAAKQRGIFLDIYISQEALHLHILNTDSVAVQKRLRKSNFRVKRGKKLLFLERSGSALIASRSGVEQSNVGSK